MGKFNLSILEKYLKHDNYSLLETGTFMGETINNILNSTFFTDYYSIEIDEERFNFCQNLFKDNQNVHLYFGNSDTMIDKIIENNKDKKFICWLDAHHMGDTATKGSSDCPLLKELEQLKKLNEYPIIYIDDMFYMLNRDDPLYETPTNPDQWPTYDELINKLYEINPNYKIITSLRKGLEDYLLAIPNSNKSAHSSNQQI